MERAFDRTVVSPSILDAVDVNKVPNPAFELVPSEWNTPSSVHPIVTTKKRIKKKQGHC